jgi:hypothetical protein
MNNLWDSKELGASEEYVRRSSPEKERELDEAIGLKRIICSLRNKIKHLKLKISELEKKNG